MQISLTLSSIVLIYEELGFEERSSWTLCSVMPTLLSRNRSPFSATKRAIGFRLCGSVLSKQPEARMYQAMNEAQVVTGEVIAAGINAEGFPHGL